jgi:hypothetical protein
LYRNLREHIRTGDVIAFGGKGNFSSIIKRFTRSPVSHVGVCLQRTMLGDDSGRFFLEIIESTSLRGFSGVVVQRMSEALDNYDGDVWVLQLSEESRTRFSEEAFTQAMFATVGKRYDMAQAIGSAVDVIMPEQREDFSKFFCSELVAHGLESAGVLWDVNSSEITPIDLCRMPIFADVYTQVGGSDHTVIPGFNGESF